MDTYADLLPAVLALIEDGYGRAQKPMKWRLDTWRKQFKDMPTAREDLESLDAKEEVLDRQLLLQVAGATVEASGAERLTLLRRLFLWSQVWGHAKTGYGAYRVRRIMETPEFEGRLQAAYEVLITEGALAAHAAMARGGSANVKGLGQAFATKFLYFAGYEWAPSRPHPLVLDKLVGLALHEAAPAVFGRRTGEDWSRADYAEYLGAVEWLSSQDELFEYDPAHIELILFQRGFVLSRGMGPNKDTNSVASLAT